MKIIIRPCLTIDERLAKASPCVVEMFRLLRLKVKSWKNVQEYLTKPYVGYKCTDIKGTPRFLEIHIRKSKLNLHLRPVEFINPNVTDAPITHLWKVTKLFDVYDKSTLDQAINMANQSYEYVKSNNI
ncbi:hypothetical protein ACVW0P_003478 [Mucilaginibacter sp. UYNi724]